MSTWIFLRGLTREADHWGGFPAVFERAMPGARIVMMDLPGNGQRYRERSPASVAGMVEACRQEAARQGIAAPMHVLAMSLGAMVAIEWARRAPTELAACVLINTSVRPFSPVFHRMRPRNYPTLLRLALTGPSPEAAERAVLRLTSNQPERHEDVIPAWLSIRIRRPVSAGNALRQLLAAARYQAPDAAPDVPLLLLGSQNDGLVDSRCSQSLARAWDRPLAMHPAAGHDLPLDDPDWVVEQVRIWVGH